MFGVCSAPDCHAGDALDALPYPAAGRSDGRTVRQSYGSLYGKDRLLAVRLRFNSQWVVLHSIIVRKVQYRWQRGHYHYAAHCACRWNGHEGSCSTEFCRVLYGSPSLEILFPCCISVLRCFVFVLALSLRSVQQVNLVLRFLPLRVRDRGTHVLLLFFSLAFTSYLILPSVFARPRSTAWMSL